MSFETLFKKCSVISGKVLKGLADFKLVLSYETYGVAVSMLGALLWRNKKQKTW
jgi:hypothetical protein